MIMDKNYIMRRAAIVVNTCLEAYFKDSPEYAPRAVLKDEYFGLEGIPWSYILITLRKDGKTEAKILQYSDDICDDSKLIELSLDIAKELEDKIKDFTFKED